jgi:hypothetical protein
MTRALRYVKFEWEAPVVHEDTWRDEFLILFGANR